MNVSRKQNHPSTFTKINFMKKFTLILAFVLISFATKAQSYVTIPDSNFVTWLTINIPSAMSGNQLDTTNSTVLSLTSMDVSNDSIFDLTGIHYFKSLYDLNCSSNFIDTMAQLPDSLRIFNCMGNGMSFLPPLPDSLHTFNCDMNNLTWLPALPNSIIDFSCEQNQLDTLPALPVNITYLRCAYNLLSRLPALPNTITTIDCQTNELDSLPTLPIGLTTLNCYNNLLTSLSTLPNTLENIFCHSNHLTSLPTLPTALINLECYSNQLTSLPTLPSSLISLTCSNNPLVTLPTLPPSLETLKCYSDSLTSLPTLPSSLTYLDCSYNFLTALPSLPSSLMFLNCNWNQLTALPSLSSLETLYCNNNLIPLFPALPSSLTFLDCGYNPIIDLPVLSSLTQLICNNATLDSIPTIPSTLLYLDCSYNNLISLPNLNALSNLKCDGNIIVALPTLPSSLNSLICSSNQLTSLPTLPSALGTLYCQYNFLTSLPPIPASLSLLYCSDNLINCFSEFPNSITQIYIHNNPFTCLANYIPAMDSITLNYPLCVLGDLVTNPNNCPSAQGLVGFTYADDNSNCIKDSTDFNLTNVPVKLYDSIGNLMSQTYTAINGVYNFAQPAGTYTAVVDTTNIPFIPMCPTPGIDSTLTTSIATPLISDINFDFNCKPGFDIGVQSIYHNGLVFPGQAHSLHVNAGDMTQWYNMHCAAGLSGTVSIKVTGPVTFTGITPGALTPVITGGIYTYTISDFGTINNKTAFGLNFTTDTTAAAGNDVCVSVLASPIVSDNDTSNNQMHLCYKVVNSHDPNFKETTPEIINPQYSDYFTYTVHFQNSGNAPAINIRLADTLDSKLDLSTFQLMNYSHANITTLTGNNLNVSFPNIMLADSTSSPDSSKGFVQYRIKAKPHMVLGNIIYNTCYIYFDYNSAIITNTTLNIYEGISGISQSEKELEANIYPNPATENITINFISTSKNTSVKFYDATGRLVKNIENVQSGENEIPLNELEKGLYLINVSDEQSSFTKRFVKQ